MDLALLIRRARESKGLSKAELARRVGVTRQTVGSWETGTSAPNRNRAPLVAKELGIPLASIAGDPKQANVAFQDENTVTYKRVPLLDWVDAGRGADVAQAYALDDAHDFIETTFRAPERGFALVVHGHSMEPEFLEGDIIIIDPAMQPQNNEYIVAEVLKAGQVPGQGEVTFKQYRSRGAGSFDLLPLNPEYPTITVNKNNPGRIVGTVVEHRRRLGH